MKVLIVSGASGGHLFPAISFEEALKNKFSDAETLFVLPRKDLTKSIIPAGYKLRYISEPVFKAGFSPKTACLGISLLKVFLESLFIFIEFHPDVVVGFGGSTSIPVVILAWLFRIKTLIHEQNVSPGRANRLLAYFADKIAVSFPESRQYLVGYSGKIILTGNPLRKEIKKINKDVALEFLGLAKDKFTLLVTGGSSGARKINLEFLGALEKISDKRKIQVIHLSGAKDYAILKSRYSDLGISVKLFDFFKDMQYAYSASDLVICRAGAGTIAELVFYSLPVILAPYPFAYAHQLQNALVLEKAQCAVIIPDDTLNSISLSGALNDFLNNPARLKEMQLNYAKFRQPEAASLLAEEALKE